MELSWLGWCLAGALAGIAAGLVPGLHANTLLPIVAALRPEPPELVVALPAFATAHAFTSILPATYLGIPDPEGSLLALPAHQMVAEGQGPRAVRIAVHATFAAVVASVVLLLPAIWLLQEPGRLGASIQSLLPWVLAALALWLLFLGWRKPLANLVCFVLAGLFGLFAARLHPSGLLGPVTPLGPALAGLFAGAGLVAAVVGSASTPPQDDEPLTRRSTRVAGRAAWVGSLAAALLVPVSAATPALVGSLIPARAKERSIAVVAAIGVAHQTLALATLWPTLRPRTGLAAALVPAAEAQPWSGGALPPLLLALLATTLLAALLAHPATLLLGRRIPDLAARLPARGISIAALALLGVLQVGLGGWHGTALFVAGTAIGLVPLALQARRLQLIACLLLPALLRSAGVSF
ncbi:MAG: tripartite tricarboxylate transporter permease [Candidatus Thermoplasmatota archaeon]